jgi:hypothetical protein
MYVMPEWKSGNQHVFPGGGCVPKETNEEIYSFHKEIVI